MATRADNDLRRGDLKALVRAAGTLGPPSTNAVEQKRQMVADFCKLLGGQVGAVKNADGAPPTDGLTPRARQTLAALLEGDSEKQIAVRLGLSRHTVHVYVKQIYRHYAVASRGELLARFVKR